LRPSLGGLVVVEPQSVAKSTPCLARPHTLVARRSTIDDVDSVLVLARKPAPKKKPKSFSRLTRTAYHEAGHAVLSSAIGDSPTHVTINADGPTLGSAGRMMIGRPQVRVQVHLAGYAAEHILTGRRPRQFVQRLGFAILFAVNRRLASSFEPELESTDESQAVPPSGLACLVQAVEELHIEPKYWSSSPATNALPIEGLR
jgi:hypothetical protein